MNKRQKKQLSPEMIESQSRREFILRALRTSGGLGLYSILLNLPPAFLLKGAMAAETAKYLIFSEHRGACPLNANVPGTYVSGVRHPTGVAFAAADIILGNTTLQGNRQGAAVWNDLDPEIRARLHFTHHSTRENNHSRSIDVMRVKGAVKNEEGRATVVIPSAIAQETAATLGTSQIKPKVLMVF
ncbi:MAG: hypothetical protein R3A45_06585 [Bdellovibrionota bacterium]